MSYGFVLAIPFVVVAVAIFAAWVFLRTLPAKREPDVKPWIVDRDGRVRTNARPIVLKAKTKAN